MACKAVTAPVKKPTSIMIGNDPTPTNSICSKNNRKRKGRRTNHARARPSKMM
jgi:hypothetical protein